MGEHVSLLKDMKDGYPCTMEAVAAIEDLEQQIFDLKAQLAKRDEPCVWTLNNTGMVGHPSCQPEDFADYNNEKFCYNCGHAIATEYES